MQSRSYSFKLPIPLQSQGFIMLSSDTETNEVVQAGHVLDKQVPKSVSTLELAQSTLFRRTPNTMSLEERTRLTYEKAKKVCEIYNLTFDDILSVSPLFSKLHTDLINAMDGGMTTLITIQYNLFIGTVLPYAASRPELLPLLHRALAFEISAQFMLTEIGHGLDARNLETTATLLPNGDFDLHSPSAAAAKCMSPTTTRSGLPVVALVIARLVVDDEDRGLRAFIVPINNGQEMCKGVTARALPTRIGTHPIDHALTLFNHVRLPHSALLGSLKKPVNDRAQFQSTIYRVGAGTLFVSGVAIPALKLAVYNAAQFSLRRKVTGHDGCLMPVIQFRTQHLPILHAIAQYHVLQAFLNEAAVVFRNMEVDPQVRHAVATIFKAVALQHFQRSIKALNEGCGWHGFFGENQILQMDLEMRAASTAEGDIRVLAIRLASELILSRYKVQPPKDPTSALARHESSLFAEAQESARATSGTHRTEAYNRNILPRSLPLIQAIGHRMASEAAVAAGLDPRLIALYESGAILEGSAWYAEKGGTSRAMQREMEALAADALLPNLERFVAETGAEGYSTAPMASDKRWDESVAGLEKFNRVAEFDPFCPGLNRL
ncbi:putative acyl-CoA oxidase [Aspergillus stella-maris]|uniref:putative acyl-CoA oxidase n=1 Tax=Aspergillus stella-maris TaxID=1810926 RepID=UPI003CCDAE64